MLDGDVCPASLVPVDGVLPVPLRRPDADLVAEAAADAQITDWWQDRIAAAQAVLDAG